VAHARVLQAGNYVVPGEEEEGFIQRLQRIQSYITELRDEQDKLTRVHDRIVGSDEGSGSDVDSDDSQDNWL
jgi:hypothetical protein